MEGRRQQFRDRLSLEIGARFERLRAQNHEKPVLPPTDGLLDAFVEALGPTWRSGSEPAIATSIEWASEAYEYIVGRWLDPRWRALVSIALDVGVRGSTAPTPQQPNGGRRHRSAGSYSREIMLGS